MFYVLNTKFVRSQNWTPCSTEMYGIPNWELRTESLLHPSSNFNSVFPSSSTLCSNLQNLDISMAPWSTSRGRIRLTRGRGSSHTAVGRSPRLCNCAEESFQGQIWWDAQNLGHVWERWEDSTHKLSHNHNKITRTEMAKMMIRSGGQSLRRLERLDHERPGVNSNLLLLGLPTGSGLLKYWKMPTTMSLPTTLLPILPTESPWLIAPRDILLAMKQLNPHSHVKARDIRNQKAKLREEELGGRTSTDSYWGFARAADEICKGS